MYCLVFSTVFAKYLSQMLPQDMCHMYDMYTRVSYTVYSVEKSRENYGAIRHAEFWGHAPLPVTPDFGFWDEGKRSRVSFMRGARGHRVYIYEWGKRAQGLVGEWAKKSQGSNGFFNVRGGTGSQGSI